MTARLPLFSFALSFLLLTGSRSFAAAKPDLAAAPAPAATHLIADLRTSSPSLAGYGSWLGNFSVTPEGIVILGSKGADGKGGFGAAIDPTLDLSKEIWIEVALGGGVENAVPEITVAFSDAAQTQYTASIRIDQVVPRQPVWFRVRLADFKLNNWQNGNPARKIDWTKVTHWDLQGDWRTGAPAHVVFIALRSRP